MNPVTLSTAAMSFSERMSYGLQVFVVGVATVFAVLIILWLALILFKVFLYDIPQKKADKKKAAEAEKAPVAKIVPEPVIEETATEDDTQLIAVITAAIAAYTSESGNSLPFRVVSYKRVSGANGWNGKNNI